MKTSYKFVLLCVPLIMLFVVHPLQTTVALQDIPSSTPTYDPLVEPPLSENPTEYELGRNLYWHWCMTCHGDRGQGLTDEFRGIWEPEHQNCWGRGCHAGRPGDEGFPIPTIVPALVNEAHLAQFISAQQLSDFLKATHPPQSPGILKDDEYHAIAVFVFTMNERSLIELPIPGTPVPTLLPTQISTAAPQTMDSSFPVHVMEILVMLIGVFLVLKRRPRSS